MINVRTGEIALTDDDIIIPKMSVDAFAASFPDATVDWEHNTRAAYKIGFKYDSGWRVSLTLHFTEDSLYDVLMHFDDAKDDDDYENRVRMHSELLTEWLGQETPYHYEWGIVQLLKDNPYSQHFISVQYS